MALFDEALVISEANFRDFTGDGTEVLFDGVPRMLAARPRGTVYGAPGAPPLAFDPSELIPENEWDRIIEQKDRDHDWLIDTITGTDGAVLVPCLDQGRTNYCHGFSVCESVMCQQAVQGQTVVTLSGESIGGEVTNWQNEGAMPEEDLRVFVELGACPESMVRNPRQIRPSTWDPAWKTERLKYRVKEFKDLQPRGYEFQAVMTAALRSRPYFIGLRWWSHAIAGGFRVRKVNGVYEILHRNNWGPSFGENGFHWLTRAKATPDLDCFTPGLIVPYDGLVLRSGKIWTPANPV